MADIYTRIQGDPNFAPDKIEITEDLELLLMQIEMILFTRQHDVLGDLGFGGDLEDLVFSTNISGSSIENIINTQIMEYIPLANTYTVDVSCEFYKGVDRDTAVLDIIVDGATVMGLLFA
jgi:hypothetical protein